MSTSLLQANRDRDILEAIPEAVCAFDPSLAITLWNPAAARLYGWSREEAIGQNLIELLRCEYDQRMSEGMAELLDTGSLQRRAYRHAKDGSLLIVDGHWAVQRDSAGAPVEIVEITRLADTRTADEGSSALMKAYQALAESEKKYRDLFNVMPIAIWQMDSRPARQLFADLGLGSVEDLSNHMRANPGFLDEVRACLKITEVNEQTLSLFGATDREDFIERMPRLWFHHAEDLIPIVNARLSGTQHYRGEATISKMDGTTREILFSAAFANLDDPESLHTIGAVDISEEKRAKGALAESEKKYRDLFNFMPIALWQLDSRKMRDMFNDLRAAGVEDIAAYIAEHPEFVDEAQATLRITEANERTLHLFNAADQEELLEAMPGLWLPGGGDWAAAAKAREAGEKYYSRESTIRRMDGSIAEVLFSVAFANPDDPESLNTVGAVDITEEKRAKEALELSEKKYRDLFNFMPIAIWQLDSRTVRKMFDDLRASGVEDLAEYIADHPEFLDEARSSVKVTEANEQTLSLFGATNREQLLEMLPHLWLRNAEEWALARKARESGASYHRAETTIQRMDDSTREVLFTAAFSNLDEPQTLTTVGAVDITEEKRAKEALEQSERKYRTLVQYMPIALVQIDFREMFGVYAKLRSEGVDDLGAYIDANPQFLEFAMQSIRVEEGNDLCCRLFGARDSAELSGPVDRFFKVMPETLKRSLAARFSGALRFMEETRLSTLDGRVLDLLYTSAFSPELSEFGIGLVGMIDIGDRLNAERRLQQIQEEVAHATRVATLGELAASIAHEVNQPLAAISVNGQASLRWLDWDPPNVEEARILAARIDADARRAADIVARIRTLAARKVPQRDLIDLADVIQETVQFLNRELRIRGINLNLHFPEKLPLVLGDRTQLQQVVLNLVMNAMHALDDQPPDRRRVTVRVAEDRNRVRVDVENVGPGIPEGDRDQLFNAFFTTKADGLGLGLSICRSIIDHHGGEIDCEHLAEGTRFLFSLPVADHQPEPSPAP